MLVIQSMKYNDDTLAIAVVTPLSAKHFTFLYYFSLCFHLMELEVNALEKLRLEFIPAIG